MITIHHLLDSQSERIVWLMEELGLPYELKSYAREGAMGLAHPVFLELSPIGQAPVIQDGGVTLAESLAITIYILDLYGNGKLRIAPGKPGYPDYVYWLSYSVGSLMPQATQHVMATLMGASDENPLAAMMKDRNRRHLGMIDKRLGANEWLAGKEFTAADILCHFPFGTLSKFAPIDISDYPNIRKWLDRVSARPGYQRGMKAAGHASDPAQIGR